jgi:glycosyltransferase involved in cell wall biosynthesis
MTIKTMRILHLNSSDLSGGASIAAYRLHKGLFKNCLDSRMIVQNKEGTDSEINGPVYNFSMGLANIRPTIDHLPKLLFRQRTDTLFHLQWLPNRLLHKINNFNPDIVHLHWICRGFINIGFIPKIRRKIIWTLHDNWPFTGGCHYTGGCNRFIHSCGRCPILNSNINFDLSRWTLKRKFEAFKNINLQLVAPSRWIASQASQSSLFKNVPCSIIPNGIDTERFKPVDQTLARNLLGLPYDKILVLFTAMNASKDCRKGLQYCLPAFRLLATNRPKINIELVVLGSETSTEKPIKGTNIHYVGRLRDELSIALVYAACDVFVAPSLEDNLPNTVVEAMSCGIPCVAFNIGGMPDIISHKISGYLVEPYSVKDLANGIQWVIASKKRKAFLAKNARNQAYKKFNIHKVVDQHIKLYERATRNIF